MLTFDEKNHVYTLDGINLISVTQLMQKYALAPNYEFVNKEVLEASAKRGTLIHKEIENFNKNGEIGFTNEMFEFKQYVEENNIKVSASEMQLHNDVVAGTCDLLLNMQSDNPIIADIKTTSKLHVDAVSWQLSIYAFLFADEEMYKHFKGQAFHFKANEHLKVVDIPLKPYETILRLMNAERKGIPFNYVAELESENLTNIVSLEALIKGLESKKKDLEKQRDALKEGLLKEMESRGLKSIEKNGCRITYIAATRKKTIDTTRLKQEQPNIYEQYLKEADVKASIKITLKDETKKLEGETKDE